MSVARIRRNDQVVVRTGRDAGKTGRVLQILPARSRAVVEGVNLVKKTLRKSQDNPQGGISEKEASMALSNLQVYCPSCKKGVRTRRERDGAKGIRQCARCGHAFDS